MTVQRYLQIQQGQQSNSMSGSSGQQQSAHRKLDRSLSEPKSPKGQNQSTSSSRYKTELCRPFEESGVCKYGDKCQFAHGFQELRTLTRHPKYKTELCCTFHTTGLCPYGSRCHFIHNPDENRAKIMPSLPMPQPINHHHQHSQQQTQPLPLQQQPQPPPPPPHHHHHHHHHHHQSHPQQPPQHLKAMHGISPAPPGHQSGLRSFSIGSNISVGSSSSSGELSPSSSPGMFDDPFASSAFYGAASASPTSSRGAAGCPGGRIALPHAFSAFGADFEMSALAAAFSAAESKRGGLSLKGAANTSAPGTPPFGSQLNLLSCSSSSSSCGPCGPWGSPSSSSSASQDMFQFSAGELHCGPVVGNNSNHSNNNSNNNSNHSNNNNNSNSNNNGGNHDSRKHTTSNPGQLFEAAGQSSPVDSLTFELDAISLGAARSRANPSPTLTRLPIFNQLAHSD